MTLFLVSVENDASLLKHAVPAFSCALDRPRSHQARASRITRDPVFLRDGRKRSANWSARELLARQLLTV